MEPVRAAQGRAPDAQWNISWLSSSTRHPPPYTRWFHMIFDVSEHYSSGYLDEVDAFASEMFHDDPQKLAAIRTLSNQLRKKRDTFSGSPSRDQDEHPMSVSDPNIKEYPLILHIVPPLEEELAFSTGSVNGQTHGTREEMAGSQRDTTHPVPEEISDRISRHHDGVTDPNAPRSLSGSSCSFVRPCSEAGSIQYLPEELPWDSGTFQRPLGEGPNGTSLSSSVMVVGTEVEGDADISMFLENCDFCKDQGDVVTFSLLPDPTKKRNFCKATHAQMAVELRVLLGLPEDGGGTSSKDVQGENDWVDIKRPACPWSLGESCVFLE